ncbi:MAG: preprotein translocase subunit SecA, partial [Myxococcota bacterium]
MLQSVFKKVIGTKNERDLRRLLPVIEQINRLEPDFEKLSDARLRELTSRLRERLEAGESLDALLPEAYAAVREASKRTLGQRQFDVQLMGGAVLHQGVIAEMKTGEGKTLVATLPAYLNALGGRGVHIVTVNDYLARFHAEWMGGVYGFLGLSVGCIVPELSDEERRQAYAADITYGTNNEFGFDYLRDNMKPSLDLCVQRDLHYAIVDEVDSCLIDEARTPLIISGPSEENVQLYGVANRLIPSLGAGTKGEHSKGIEETGDYWIDEKAHSATLTEQGIHKVEKMLGVENLYDPGMLPVLHAVNQALVAHTLKKRDVDYVVRAGETGKKEVIIVDEFTGRLMAGRRWSDGLHQAVEAKEGMTVQSENQTLASITFQNYFRMYDKLSGMTGTADTEAPEFAKIYDLDVMVVPSNRPMIREDFPDLVYKTPKEKFKAVVEEIKELHETGQPILVGTISIETSEMLARMLQRQGIKHNVLNAKHHSREAEIVAQAGRKAAVTISTNMAGRGTDIILGGNPEMLALSHCKEGRDDPEFAGWVARYEAECAQEREAVVEAGGLHIMGTERHESRRIDNQLRGRSGRQGDPGSSRFFLSLEDDLLRIFGSERITPWMERLGLQEDEAIEHRFITRAIANAQKKVEARNFDMRKHLLDYDDVMNRQRQAFYTRRREILSREDIHSEVLEMAEGQLVSVLASHWPEKGDPDPEQLGELGVALDAQYGVQLDPTQEPFVVNGRPCHDRDALGRAVHERLVAVLEAKRAKCDGWALEHADTRYPDFETFEREILRQTLDRLWKDHLHSMDSLREGINLRGYAQKDPKVEYQREGYGLFAETEDRIDQQATEIVFKFVLPDPVADRAPAPPIARPAPPRRPGSVIERGGGAPAPRAAAAGDRSGKVGRNS